MQTISEITRKTLQDNGITSTPEELQAESGTGKILASLAVSTAREILEQRAIESFYEDAKNATHSKADHDRKTALRDWQRARGAVAVMHDQVAGAAGIHLRQKGLK